MNYDAQEKTVRQYFRQLKQKDERLAPAFANVWSKAVSQTSSRHRPRHPALRLAIVTGGLTLFSLFLIVFLWRPFNHSGQDAFTPAFVEITEWRAPTDVLLRSSNHLLLHTTPTLGERYFGVTKTLHQTSEEL